MSHFKSNEMVMSILLSHKYIYVNFFSSHEIKNNQNSENEIEKEKWHWKVPTN